MTSLIQKNKGEDDVQPPQSLKTGIIRHNNHGKARQEDTKYSTASTHPTESRISTIRTSKEIFNIDTLEKVEPSALGN